MIRYHKSISISIYQSKFYYSVFQKSMLLNPITLENAVYMNVKNDLAFLIDFHLHLYEHQSAYNPNMPLRDLFYVSREYQKLVESRSIYTSKGNYAQPEYGS